MKKNIFLSLLIFGSSAQAAKVRSFKKYAIYLGCATAGCISTLLAAKYKKTRPHFRKILFPHYVEAHENLNNQITTVTLQLQNTNNRMANINGLLETADERVIASEQARNLQQNHFNQLRLSNFQLQKRFTHYRIDQTSKNLELNILKTKVYDEYLPLIHGLTEQLKMTQEIYKAEAKLFDENINDQFTNSFQMTLQMTIEHNQRLSALDQMLKKLENSLPPK